MKMVSPKTKIVCTIGPASESPEVMKQMIEAGMNVARLNFSHGEFASHKKVIENLRAAVGIAGAEDCHHGRPLRPEDAYREVCLRAD